MKYNISYKNNDIYQSVLINAPSKDVASTYFYLKEPGAEILGLKEASRDDERPDKPVLTARLFQVWKDCELGQTYCEKSFLTKPEAEDWLCANERAYPGWHLRVVEVKDAELALDDVIKTCEKLSKNNESRTEKNEYYKTSDGFFDYYVNRRTGEKKLRWGRFVLYCECILYIISCRNRE